MTNIAVVGAGYVGLVTSACLAKMGNRVTCIERDSNRLEQLQAGRAPIYEPELDDILWEQVTSGRLSFTADYAATIPESSFCFVAVNTPPRADGSADTTNVFDCVDSVLEYSRPGLVIVIKSTVPVGTGEEVAARVRKAGVESVDVVSNPEFLRQSSAVKDFLCPDRVVVGSSSLSASRAVQALYESLDCPVILCSHRSAELGKYAANSYLATRISFINEIAGICEATGADIVEVSVALGLDHRVGQHYLQPGLGYGGSCLPKDVMALRSTASMFGYTPSILQAVEDTNQRLPALALGKLMTAAGLRPGSTVGVLGLAFKPNTDDIRGAPAMRVIKHLLEMGCMVKAHDPMAMAQVSGIYPEVHYCQNVYEVAEDADALVLATEWREYIDAEWRVIRERMRGQTILDGRHALDQNSLSELGFNYVTIGGRLQGSVLEFVSEGFEAKGFEAKVPEMVKPLRQDLRAG